MTINLKLGVYKGAFLWYNGIILKQKETKMKPYIVFLTDYSCIPVDALSKKEARVRAMQIMTEKGITAKIESIS